MYTKDDIIKRINEIHGIQHVDHLKGRNLFEMTYMIRGAVAELMAIYDIDESEIHYAYDNIQLPSPIGPIEGASNER